MALAFVLPHWQEYQFYNWEMTVTRKPSYGLRDLIDRASWLPVVQDFFSRMWLVLVGAAMAIAAVAARWRTARPAERLLVLWVLVGLLELTVHDSGNERRYVMFIPALIALAALIVASDRPWLPSELVAAPSLARWIAVPLLLLLGYLVFGSVVRLAFLEPGSGGRCSRPRFVSPQRCAAVATSLVIWRWARDRAARLCRRRVPVWAAGALLVISLAGTSARLPAGRGRGRSSTTWRRSRSDGRSRRARSSKASWPTASRSKTGSDPLFVGHGFGNYADRLTRDDARYILTYVCRGKVTRVRTGPV